MTPPTVEPDRPPEAGAATQPSAATQPDPAARGTDQIGAWLDRLVRVTRLRPPEADELRDELDAHLRERVRDLMLTGHDEADAIHKSISELGDLALLAQRYRDAVHTPRRRFLMHAMLIGVVGSVVGLGVVALQPETPQAVPSHAGDDAQAGRDAILDRMVSEFIRQDDAAQVDPAEFRELGDPVPVLRDLPFTSRTFFAGMGTVSVLESSLQDESLRDVLFALAEPQGAQVFTYWDSLSVTFDEEITYMPFEGQTVEKALEILSDSLLLAGGDRLDHRVENGLMEFASRDFFDRREVELVSYDISGLVDVDSPLEQSIDSEVLTDLIIAMIEPAGWMQTRGSSSLQIAGARLFVNAPRRVHTQVVWLLAELESQNQAAVPIDAPNGFAGADNVVTIYTTGFSRAEDIRPVVEAAVAPLGAQVASYGEDGEGLAVVGPESAHVVVKGLLGQLDRADQVPDNAARRRSHVVEEGESLASIASRYLGARQRASEILGANPGLDANQLSVGQRIAIPATGPAQADEGVSIRGAVHRPGAYQMPGDSPLTLRRLIASAGGMSAGVSEISVRRGEQTFVFDREVLASGAPEITLSPRDEVVVSGASAR